MIENVAYYYIYTYFRSVSKAFRLFGPRKSWLFLPPRRDRLAKETTAQTVQSNHFFSTLAFDKQKHLLSHSLNTH